MPVPDRIANAPELFLGLALFYLGFLALTSTRQLGLAQGPIPYMAMMDYCLAHGIEGEQQEDFIWLVARLDLKYLEWSARRGKPGGPSSGKSG